MASVAFNGIITFWDLKTSEKTGGQTVGPRDFLLTSAFSPDGTKLVSVGAKSATSHNVGYGKVITKQEPDLLVRLTDVRTRRELATLTKTAGGFLDEGNMTFSPDGKRVAFHGSGKIHVWHTETRDVLTISPLEQNHETPGELLNDLKMINRLTTIGLLEEVTVLVFSPDGKKLVSGAMGGKVHMWDAATGTKLTTFLAGQNPDDKETLANFSVAIQEPIKALAFSSNGALLAIGSEHKIRLLGRRKQPPS